MKFTRYSLLFLLLAFFMWGGRINAQQDPQFSQYMFNPLAYNPAYAGSRTGLSAVMLIRKQWVGLDGAPFTGTVSLHAPSRNLRHGFGATLVHDRLGITRQNFLSASYAYRIPLGPGALALGLRGGITHFSNVFSDLNPLENDQMNPGVNLSVLLPRVGAGIYYHTDRFYLGFSTPNFIQGTYDFDHQGSQPFTSQQAVHYFGTIGGAIPLGDNLDFRPSAVVKYVQNAPVELDFNAAIFYKKFLWLGLGYRTRDAIIGMVELVFENGTRLGYAYDYTLTNLGRVNSGSHELMLGIDLKRSLSRVRSPRYF